MSVFTNRTAKIRNNNHPYHIKTDIGLKQIILNLYIRIFIVIPVAIFHIQHLVKKAFLERL